MEKKIAVCGHVSHGKSTLIGRLAKDCGQIDSKVWKSAQQLVDSYKGKADINIYNAFVYLSKDELLEGNTRNVPHLNFSLPDDFNLTIIDTPGHVKYGRGRSHGIFLADACILVVSLVDGIQSQTLESLLFMRALHVPLGGVVFTKSDLLPEGAIAKSDSILGELQEIIEKNQIRCTFDPNNIPHTTISALKDPDISSVLDLFRSITVVRADLGSAPLRLCTQGIPELFKIEGVGPVIKAIVESGTLQKGDQLILEPASTKIAQHVQMKARGIMRARGRNERSRTEQNVESAIPRDIVSINVAGIDYSELYEHLKKKGGTLGHPDAPPRVATKILAEVTIVNKPNGAFVGWEPYLMVHSVAQGCRLSKVVSVMGENGNYVSPKASVIKEGSQAKVEITFKNPITIEEIDSVPKMARFSLRDNNIIEAFGICLRILE